MNIQTPFCCGMQRSASRHAWQITKVICGDVENREEYKFPKEYLSKYSFYKDRNGYSGEELWNVFPPRGHSYVSEVPIIFTYRNPIEAFLSLRQKYSLDIERNDNESITNQVEAANVALNHILASSEVFDKLLKDRENGRTVLFLKYEDYYDSPLKKIDHISRFVGISLSDDKKQLVADQTSLQNNFERGKITRERAEKLESGFSRTSHKSSGMQSFHVSPITMGKPGAWKENFSDLYNLIVSSDSEACVELCRYAKLIGYSL